MNGRCIIVAGLCAAAVLPSAGLAGAPVAAAGRFVRLASEEAIIVWDEGARREHFIRRASFDTDAKDFGFLVPTPGKPELAESDDAAFDVLAEITSPVAAALAGRAAPDAVTLLEQARVAGFDAVVLEATDADAVDGWLRRHGYPSSPELVEWYAPYLAANWKITAFKIAAASAKVSTAALRMSFQTERPFFPYREPATQRVSANQPRLLRVSLVAAGRMAGTLGEASSWPGKAVWANEIGVGELARLLKAANLPSMAGGGARWLTQFEDRGSPRPGNGELYFHRDASNAKIERAPGSLHGGWDFAFRVIAAAFLALLIGGAGWWAWRRHTKHQRPEHQ